MSEEKYPNTMSDWEYVLRHERQWLAAVGLTKKFLNSLDSYGVEWVKVYISELDEDLPIMGADTLDTASTKIFGAIARTTLRVLKNGLPPL